MLPRFVQGQIGALSHAQVNEAFDMLNRLSELLPGLESWHFRNRKRRIEIFAGEIIDSQFVPSANRFKYAWRKDIFVSELMKFDAMLDVVTGSPVMSSGPSPHQFAMPAWNGAENQSAVSPVANGIVVAMFAIAGTFWFSHVGDSAIRLIVQSSSQTSPSSNRYIYVAKPAAWDDNGKKWITKAGSSNWPGNIFNIREMNNTPTLVLDGLQVGVIGNITRTMLPIQPTTEIEVKAANTNITGTTTWEFTKDNIVQSACNPL